VLNFRLVYDKETGRPKGFGFAEYADQDSAASAVRNLNETDMNGRKLRVDWSNDGGKDDNTQSNLQPPPTFQPPPMGMNGHDMMSHAQQQQPPQANSLPPLPPGAEVPPNLTCPDAISRTLKTLPAPQLLDILSQMKGLAMTDPSKATELLRQAPQLSYAIFQSLLLLNLVDTTVLTSILEQTALQPQAAPSMPPQPPQSVQPPMPPQQQQQQQQYPGYPPQFQHQQPIHTPPVGMNPYQPPPLPQQQAPPPQQQQQQQAPGGMPMLTPEMIRGLMGMSQAQIDALGPVERQQIVALRQQLQGMMGGQGY